MTQKEKVLKIILFNPEKQEWTAKDFQYGENFIGYEASARMSEIANEYKEILTIGKRGRFRTISVNWAKKKEIEEIKKILQMGENNEKVS